jgi:hypothetical protein
MSSADRTRDRGAFAHPGLERGGQVSARSHESGAHRGEQRGDNGAAQRNAERSPVGGEVEIGTLREQQAADRNSAPLRDEESRHAAKEREHERLGDELHCKPAPAHAEGEAYGDFAAAAQDARKHEVCDVRAGDDQHDSRDSCDPEEHA